jgi:hypothetical protein
MSTSRDFVALGPDMVPDKVPWSAPPRHPPATVSLNPNYKESPEQRTYQTALHRGMDTNSDLLSLHQELQQEHGKYCYTNLEAAY